MERICVYCGSSPGHDPAYRRAAREMGEELLARDLGLVFGGGSVGLMGTVADAVMDGGGEAIGVIPESLESKEVAHGGLTDLEVVESMHERKQRMVELSDGFVALPGGLGTLEEIFEVLTWAQLGIHEKPCGVLNVAGFYDGLVSHLDGATEAGFVSPTHRDLARVETHPGALLDAFAAYEPPSEPKVGPEDT
ncbi:TIGR00730 family Rossman fold protein [Haloglomus litoreum]|uniref:LOG family protein n=1 Tax=Haloglomus litoreum TaxID=3034026 RepID=UPI0023E895DD|nr:TIGR00730 family Rossman fold protein [Haloglomus sp. DT116]